MPQHKLIYRSIILSTILLSIILQLVQASPLLYDEMEDKGRDKRSFYDIQCKGLYDKTIFARVDQICEDCYNIFREPKLHSLCRQQCFTSDYFKGCVDILRLSEEFDKIQDWIRRLNGLGV